MMKKKLFCAFFVFVILSGVAHGSHYNSLGKRKPYCCYDEKNPPYNHILCRVGSCEVPTKAVALVAYFFTFIGICSGGVAFHEYNKSGSNPDGPVFNNTSSTGMSSFAAIQPHKPSVPAMQRDSGFEQLHSQSNSTHIASLLKRNNKKKQS